MVESPDTNADAPQQIRDEGGILLLLLTSDPAKYWQEKNNLQHLVEPQDGINPEDLEQQRQDFLKFYHKGWTILDLQSLLSYLGEHEDSIHAIIQQHPNNPQRATEALACYLEEND